MNILASIHVWSGILLLMAYVKKLKNLKKNKIFYSKYKKICILIN